MKTVVIGSLVAAIIVFVFQAMSWMVLPIHENSLKYTPQQDAILTALTENLPEGGMYAIPNVPPGSTQEQRTEFDKSMVGKSWAVIQYQPNYEGMMSSQLVYGFMLNLVAAFILAYVMWTTRGSLTGFGSRFGLAVGFTVFLIFQSSLMQANWWETPWHYLSGEITDHIVGWMLGGVWLAWFLGRKPSATSSS
jgi:hypothetical protein